MTKSTHVFLGAISTLLILVFLANPALALTLNGAITAIADRLEAEQIKDGADIGSWPEEATFTGSIVAGMIDSYELTGESAYKDSAQLGGNYIFRTAQGSFYADESLAFTRLSAIADDPLDNVWRSAVSYFYFQIKYGFDGGTYGYISIHSGRDPSEIVISLANLLVAANYVNAKDLEIWRQGLINWLSHVDDSCALPVTTLGIAMWALAKTGPLDDTLIDPFGTGAPYWNMKRLKDLPGLLLSHQVPDGESGTGSFYWRFDHGDGNSDETQISGYTEDTIFATRGLIAAYSANPDPNDPNLTSAILSAHEVLLGSVSPDGIISELLSREGAVYYLYAGEMLNVLRELESVLPKEKGLGLDNRVNSIETSIVAKKSL
ncbi:MAG: hypothetical protein A2167_00415 [Planctomycetes bacterium RBG_13_46_10]|nr:MAG: hypothetical protein A2167_00415 [Planctomycetes bacterium RBG_13_46_10]